MMAEVTLIATVESYIAEDNEFWLEAYRHFLKLRGLRDGIRTPFDA